MYQYHKVFGANNKDLYLNWDYHLVGWFIGSDDSASNPSNGEDIRYQGTFEGRIENDWDGTSHFKTNGVETNIGQKDRNLWGRYTDSGGTRPTSWASGMWFQHIVRP
jgi:hypothetical protein